MRTLPSILKQLNLKKSLFRQREKGYTYIGGIKRDLPPAPENEDSNKFKVVYLNRNSQLHNHRMRND